MTVHKRVKKNARSSITIQLSADHADFVVRMLSKELDDSNREGQADQALVIMDILRLFRNAIELEERMRSMRRTVDGKKAQKNKSEHNKML